MLGPRRLAAADPEPKDFDIPAGDATATLGNFSAQAGSGERVLYSVEAVEGVQTNAVKGRFTAFQAVDLMVSGTPLEALIVDQTGAITVWRRSASGPSRITGPEAPAGAENPNPSDQLVQMSAFEVATTQGHGYVATNAATALKTNESIMDIPQGVTVMSRDLIDDIGFANTTAVLQFFGLSDGFSGEANADRGMAVSYAYVAICRKISPMRTTSTSILTR